jgi:primase-polymerase (primpol)-like protein
MDELLTTRQAFEAMRLFVAQFNEREPTDQRLAIELLLAWTEIEADGVTSDPAHWSDWEAAVEAARERYP